MADAGQAKPFGLIGGLGPGATMHYYEGLLRACAARGLTPDLTIIHADVRRVLSTVEKGDLAGLARYLADLIQRLAAAGAELAAIPAFTPHICFPVLRDLSPIPLISIIDVLKADLARRGVRRIALFGTRFTVETAMFGQLAEFEVVAPTPDDIARVHGIYVQIVADGAGRPEQAAQLREIALRLIDRERVESIVLAGTELALLLDVEKIDYPAIDCARLHIEEILRRVSGAGSPR